MNFRSRAIFWYLTQDACLNTYAHAHVETFVRVLSLKSGPLNGGNSLTKYSTDLIYVLFDRAFNCHVLDAGFIFALKASFLVKKWIKETLASSINCRFIAKTGWCRSHDQRKWRQRIGILYISVRDLLCHNIVYLPRKFQIIWSITFGVIDDFVKWSSIIRWYALSHISYCFSSANSTYAQILFLSVLFCQQFSSKSTNKIIV